MVAADAAGGRRIATGSALLSRAAPLCARQRRASAGRLDAGRRTGTAAALARRRRGTEPPRDIAGLQGRAGVALPCRLQVPAERTLQVGRDAIPVLVEACDQVLRAGVAVLGSRFIPLGGKRPILRRAAPEKVLCAELHLRVDVSLLRSLFPPLGRRGERARDPGPAFIEQAEAVLGLRHAGLRRLAQPVDALFR